MVTYDYDINAILDEPIKNRQVATIRDAFLKIHNDLKERGRKSKFYIMDIECSSKLKEAMEKYEIDFQLAPPHMHRQNAAERAIRTCKNCFIYEFSTTDPDIPISNRDRLISHCVITFNILQNSKVNPALSAYAYLFGPYDFNKSPMVPPGTRLIVHEKSSNRKLWGHHGTKGWYIGPSLDHYRCIQFYMPATGIVRITDTFQYIQKVFFSLYK